MNLLNYPIYHNSILIIFIETHNYENGNIYLFWRIEFN